MFGFDPVLSTLLYIVLLVSAFLLVDSLIKVTKKTSTKEIKDKAKENLLYVFVGALFIFCFYLVSVIDAALA